MNYLARALTGPETKRYVLAASDEDEATRQNWEVLGIRRIEYPKLSDDNHRGLYAGMSGLANFVQRDSTDWKCLIAAIARQPPSDDEEQMDLIDFAFQDAELTRHFTSADTPPEWTEWLAKRNYFDGLFTTGGNRLLDERDKHLSWWLAEKFAREYADQLFQLISEYGMCLHPHLWWTLGRAIGEETDTPIQPETFSRWVSIFLSTPPPFSEQDQEGWLTWEHLGERCMEAGLTDSCIDIFEHMADSRLELNRPFAQFAGKYFKPNIRPELKPLCDYATIKGLWDRALKPKLADAAEPFLSRIADIFERRHRILHSWQSANRANDPLEFHRNSIISHEEPHYRKPIDLMIDAARDCLEHLLEHDLESAAFWCEQLIKAEHPILRQLAVHTLFVRKDKSATEKIDWLLSRDDILDYATEDETLQVLRAAYSSATTQQREKFIHAVLAYSWPLEDEEDRDNQAARKHFHWLSWLNQSDPNCTLTKQALESVQRDYPDYPPQEEPEIDIPIAEGWTGHASPWSVEELLARPAEEWADELLTFQESGFLSPDRRGLQDAVATAATEKFEWGLQLADTLAANANWRTDLWSSLMRSWCGALDQEEQGRVLGYLRNSDLLAKYGREVIEVLSAVIGHKDLICTSQILSEANRIAKQLGEHRGQTDLDPFLDGWLMRAINSMAGRLAEYWLYSLDAWRKRQDPDLNQLSPEYRSVFHEIIIDTTLAGTLGKAVLACNSAYLLQADEEWTQTTLLPLFANADNPQVYQAVWDGFLSGRKTLRLADLLKDSFLKAISRRDTLLPGTNLKENFVCDFTLMLEYIVSDPTEILNSWIPSLFANADEEDRVRFAHEIESRIQRMEDDRQRDWWQRWLERYLENRLLGVPAPLAPGEVEAILGWLPHFRSLFPDAVKLAAKFPPQQLDHIDVLYRIKNGSLWETYPESVADLLAYLDKCTLSQWGWHFEGKELITKLLESNLADVSKRNLLELSARRGLNL